MKTNSASRNPGSRDANGGSRRLRRPAVVFICALVLASASAAYAFFAGTASGGAVTTIASGSNNATLPQSAIDVASTTGFLGGTETIDVVSSTGTQTVSCTGTSASPVSFTGCSGGTGTMSTGNLVTQGPVATAGSLGEPTSFQAAVASSTSVNLSWVAPSNPAETSYTLIQSPGTLAGCSATPSAGTIACTATGLTAGTPYTWTLTAVDDSWNSTSVTASATPGTAPAITSASSTNFTTGTAGNFMVTTSGAPAVNSITNASGGGCTISTYPTGVAFTYTSGTTATITSTSGSPAGTYIFCLTASNGISPNATQTFTLTIGAATSCPTTTYTLAGNTTVDYVLLGGGGGTSGSGGSGGAGATITGTLANTTSSPIGLTLNPGCAGGNGGTGNAGAGGTPAGSPYASGGSGGAGHGNGHGGGAGGGSSSIQITSSGALLALAGGGGGGGGSASGGTAITTTSTNTSQTGKNGTSAGSNDSGGGGGGGGAGTSQAGGGAVNTGGNGGLSFPNATTTVGGVTVTVGTPTAGSNGGANGSANIYSPLLYRGYGGSGAAWAGTSQTQSVPYPTGTKANDLLFLVIANDSNTATPTPGGWTQIADQGQTGFRYTVWTKLAGAETSVSVTPSTASTMGAVVFGYYRPDGYPPNPAAAATVQQGISSASATMTPSTNVTTTQGYATTISFVGINQNHFLSLSSAQGFTEEFDGDFGAPLAQVGVADQVIPSVGSVTSPTWSQSGSPNPVWAWVTVAYN